MGKKGLANKLLAGILSTAMIVTMIPVNALAEENSEIFSGGGYSPS